MRTAQLTEIRQPLELVDLPDPEVPDGGVVLRVLACGVCRSDWHVWSGGDAVAMPHIPGHEYCGEVIAVGAGVKRWSVGDRVIAPFILACGQCSDCAAGNQTICADQALPGFTMAGAFAEKIAVPFAEGLKEGGVDVLWLETISAPEEYRAAAEAFKLAGMPWCGTMSFDTAGRTMMGVTSADLVTIAEGLDNPPLAFGANCGTGAADLLRTVLGFSASGAHIPLIAKGNAGIPQYVDGHICYNGTPELMADYAELARNAGATIIGGCCGTQTVHLRSMREALETRPRGEKPTLEEIVAKIGAFSSASDGTEAPAEGSENDGRRRSRRRRT